MPETPEQKARREIDAKLIASGWIIQDRKDLDLTAGRGIAVREFPMKSGFGFADYLLYLDRKALGAKVFGQPAEMKRLEAILHPLVRDEERRFLQRCRRARRDVAVLDIPLLFETGGEKRCDGVVVVTAPQFLQSQRVLKRQGMTPARFRQILGAQMPDREKRRRADWVVETGLGRRPTLAALARVVQTLRK